MSYFAKLWAVIRGLFIRAGDDVVSSSPQAIQATYASAIDRTRNAVIKIWKKPWPCSPASEKRPR